jgi:hypothetical protein
MTAKQAINTECRRCCGEAAQWRNVCASDECPIHFTRDRGSSVRRIKEFCIKCNPKQTLQGSRECDGLYFDGSTCVLHPFREGRNPQRPKGRVWTPEMRDIARRRFARKQPAEAFTEDLRRSK